MESESMNVILYCSQWDETVAFYRDMLGFKTKSSTGWLAEFEVGPNACLSVADAKRTSIRSSGGAGITVAFKVADVRRVWQTLKRKHVELEPIRDSNLGGQAFFLRDPEGNRLEFWSKTSS